MQNIEDKTLLSYMDGLFCYAMFLTRDYASAEDLVQETYLRALTAKHRLRKDSNLKTWLFTILRNVWLNQLRRRRTALKAVDLGIDRVIPNFTAGNSTDPHMRCASKMESEQVREAINKLPAEFREIIILREHEELSYKEIASVLGCPVGTVMSRLGRARSRLRLLLSRG